MNGRFRPGDPVRVKAIFPPGHVRTPHYARGKRGTIAEVLGAFGNPEELAYGRRPADPSVLYRVRFAQPELWPEPAVGKADTVVIDIFEHWLEPGEATP
jgi:nitrile hydratase subunit beta